MKHESTALRITLFSIAGNALLAAIKWVAGIIGNSQALIADAIESTADIFSSFLVYVGISYASRPADENHPYGHGRAEPLFTFITVAFMVISASFIAYGSINNILHPTKAPAPFTLIVLGGIIIWKEISYQYVIRKSKATKSTALKAEAWHHRSDAITSVTAFIGISISLLFGEGFVSAEDWAALFAACVILYNSYKIFRPALGEIMDEHLHEELITDIRKKAMEIEGVRGTEKCYVRKTGMFYQVDLHVIVDSDMTVRDGHALGHQVEGKLKSEIPSITYILVHIEPEDM